MSRGKVMLGLVLGNEQSQDDEKELADLNIEDTITNKENIATTSTSYYDSILINVSNGEELVDFKRTLRNKTLPNYFEENDEDKDFSGETISSQYMPTESSLASTETFNSMHLLSECGLPEGRSVEETETCKSMELLPECGLPSRETCNSMQLLPSSETSGSMHSLITPSDLGFATEANAAASSTKRQYPKKKEQGKKRQRNPTTWKSNISKKLKNSGLQFTNNKGQVIKERQLGPGCTNSKCVRKCLSIITGQQRMDIFKGFWQLADHNKQMEYLARFVKRVKKKTVALDKVFDSRRCWTYEYYLLDEEKQIRVCKKMFLDTFDISDMWITTLFKKMDKSDGSFLEADMRGKHKNRGNAIENNVKESVREHIRSIPVKESHYVRSRSSKLYFDESLTFPKLYRLYTEWLTSKYPTYKAANIDQYRRIFNTEFNINFFVPKKDQCLTCTLQNTMSEDEKKKNKEVYAYHMANKIIVRQLKEKDKEESLKSNTVAAACFDLQKILTTPQSEVSAFYYKRKFLVYNFTIYDLGKAQGYCYVWDETVGKKGPNEISSAMFNYIRLKASEGVTEFRFYSDCCGGQNRNRIIFLMYVYAAKTFGVNITHNFFEVGHSQSEGDSMHALIERRKKNQTIYIPQQWYTLIQCAKTTGKPYILKEVTQKDIFDFKSLLTLIPNWEIDQNNKKVMWSKIQHINISSYFPNILNFQYNFYDDRYSTIDLESKASARTRRKSNTKSLNSLWDIKLPLAYKRPLNISKAKFQDLMSLCNTGAIPEQYKIFYVNLPHAASDAVDDNNVSTDSDE